jgi:hypothetical protein
MMNSFREEPIDDPALLKTAFAVTRLPASHGMRAGLTRAAMVVAVLLATAPALKAEHATISLRVSGQNKEAEAHADEEPPSGGSVDPPVLNVKAHEPLVLQFILKNTYPHRVIEHVTVRYYITRVDKRGRKQAPSFRESAGPDKNRLPLLEEGVVTKGQIVMTFKPDCHVGARLKFQLPEPGLYSARIDTLNTQSDHEHFSAIDLVAE